MCASRVWQACRIGTLEHGLNCFARVVRALLGATAVAAHKMECGMALVVLGVQLTLYADGYECRPSREKMEKCGAAMREALASMTLHAGAAAKLAGRLMWGTQYLFHRLGRAMLQPIFAQKANRCGMICCMWRCICCPFISGVPKSGAS